MDSEDYFAVQISTAKLSMARVDGIFVHTGMKILVTSYVLTVLPT